MPDDGLEIEALQKLVAQQRGQLAQEMVRRQQAERELRASQELLNGFLDNSPVVVYMKDEQGRYVYVNRALQESMDRPLADWLGKTAFDLLPLDVALEFEAQDKQVLAVDGVCHFEAITKSWCGATKYWITIKFPTRDAEGRRFVIGMSIDVTEQKLAEQALRASQNRLQAILDNTATVIYLKDLEGRYLLANRRWKEIFNYEQADIIGKTALDLFPPEVAEKLRANDQQVLASGECLQFEETQIQDDGPHVYLSAKFPVFDANGKIEILGGISTDITERKRAAEALKAEREFLQHIIAVQDQQRQLITYEIHDGLVQYSTGALMELEAIHHQLDSPAIASQVEKVVTILRRTVDEGRRLINGIRSPVLDDLGVVAAIEQVIRDIPQSELEVEFCKDDDFGRCTAVVEEALLRIAQEAMTNARKHSQSQKLLVELFRQNDRVCLRVTDAGVGFKRRSGSIDVHGLRGMEERARIAGGNCLIESSPGKGTAVKVDLPYVGRD